MQNNCCNKTYLFDIFTELEIINWKKINMKNIKLYINESKTDLYFRYLYMYILDIYILTSWLYNPIIVIIHKKKIDKNINKTEVNTVTNSACNKPASLKSYFLKK